MRATLILLIALGGLLIGGLLVIRYAAQEQWRQRLTAYELHFGRGIDARSVATFLGSLSGLAGPRWIRTLYSPAVVFEVEADQRGIRHHLLVEDRANDVVMSALRSALPGVRVTRGDPSSLVRGASAVELRLSSEMRPLRTDNASDVSAALLTALQPLGPGEQVALQWSLAATGPMPGPTADVPERFRPRPPDARRAMQQKQATALFLTTVRIAASASSTKRRRNLLRRVVAPLHLLNAPGVYLQRRAVPSWMAARRMRERRLPLVMRPCLLSAAELAGCVAFPLGDLSRPGLRLGGTRQLPPAPVIPSRGRVVAESTFPGHERSLAVSVTDSLRHLHVIGPTGVGKSTLLLNLICQDITAGRGVVVLDPKGDLVGDVLDRIPDGRIDDVVVLDPSDDERPVGFNLLTSDANNRELIVEQVAGTMHNLFKAFWGPRTDDILRAALLTLLLAPGQTLCEVPLLLTDASFRRHLVGRVDDPVALAPFWAWYDSQSETERAQAIGPLMNKLRALLLRRQIRNVVGQAEPAFDLARAVREQRIVLVPLAKGRMGEEAASLLGSLVVARLWQVVLERTAQPHANRTPVFAYVDELQDYLHLPTSVGDVLAQARGLGLGMVLAHQYLRQLPTELRQGVMANARSRVIFQVSADDANALVRDLAPHLEARDLQGLAAREVVVRLVANDETQPPATGRTLPPPGTTGNAEAARAASRARYGTDRSEVEAAIRARHGDRSATGPIGRVGGGL